MWLTPDNESPNYSVLEILENTIVSSLMCSGWMDHWMCSGWMEQRENGVTNEIVKIFSLPTQLLASAN